MKERIPARGCEGLASDVPIGTTDSLAQPPQQQPQTALDSPAEGYKDARRRKAAPPRNDACLRAERGAFHEFFPETCHLLTKLGGFALHLRGLGEDEWVEPVFGVLHLGLRQLPRSRELL